MGSAVLSVAAVLLGLGSAAPVLDTIPPRVSEFRGGHLTLLEEALGTQGYATITMVMDHHRVARLLDEMAGLTASDPAAYARRAHRLDALVRAHFAQEEDFILPILSQRLSAGEFDAVVARMRQAEPY
jgi:hypothetical protein